jgi:hypothetical protein
MKSGVLSVTPESAPSSSISHSFHRQRAWYPRSPSKPECSSEGVRNDAVLDALPGKKPLIKLSYRAPNYETPIEYFRTAITPTDAFFVRYHLSNIPELDAKTWKLSVGGDGANVFEPRAFPAGTAHGAVTPLHTWDMGLEQAAPIARALVHCHHFGGRKALEIVEGKLGLTMQRSRQLKASRCRDRAQSKGRAAECHTGAGRPHEIASCQHWAISRDICWSIFLWKPSFTKYSYHQIRRR